MTIWYLQWYAKWANQINCTLTRVLADFTEKDLGTLSSPGNPTVEDLEEAG